MYSHLQISAPPLIRYVQCAKKIMWMIEVESDISQNIDKRLSYSFDTNRSVSPKLKLVSPGNSSVLLSYFCRSLAVSIKEKPVVNEGFSRLKFKESRCRDRLCTLTGGGCCVIQQEKHNQLGLIIMPRI